jgi:hypothetical protein
MSALADHFCATVDAKLHKPLGVQWPFAAGRDYLTSVKTR